VRNRRCELFPSSLCGGWLGAKAEFMREHLPEIHIEHPANLTTLIAHTVHKVGADEAKRQSGLAQLACEPFNGPSLVAWRRVGRHSPFGFVIMRGE
jgi:hypothetical protein